MLADLGPGNHTEDSFETMFMTSQPSLGQVSDPGMMEKIQEEENWSAFLNEITVGVDSVTGCSTIACKLPELHINEEASKLINKWMNNYKLLL